MHVALDELQPEGYFGKYENTSIRLTRFWKQQKGIFGHVLSYAGVVEDHVKGTLHFHLILFGSITSYVLQELSKVNEICTKIAEALDTIYSAKFSTKKSERVTG